MASVQKWTKAPETKIVLSKTQIKSIFVSGPIILNLLSFNREKNNLSTIKSIIKEEFEIFNTKYLIRGLIYCPFHSHYNGLIINLLEDFHVLKKNKNYFYDDRLNNNEIIDIKDNWRDMINSNLPNILIYVKQ